MSSCYFLPFQLPNQDFCFNRTDPFSQLAEKSQVSKSRPFCAQNQKAPTLTLKRMWLARLDLGLTRSYCCCYHCMHLLTVVYNPNKSILTHTDILHTEIIKIDSNAAVKPKRRIKQFIDQKPQSVVSIKQQFVTSQYSKWIKNNSF